jgi:hypothetical protein
MANPFPGMDPYLEDTIWQSVHAHLATDITRFLAPRLAPKYIVLTTERVVLASSEESDIQIRMPDVGVATDRIRGEGVAAVADPPLTARAIDLEAIPQFSVEVRAKNDRRLVTAIEIRSTTNKLGSGHIEFAGKRRELLMGDAHLVEIDLLRAGRRFPVKLKLPEVPYFAFVSRVEQRPNVGIWPMPLRVPLSQIPIPLDPGDADIMLDLQSILHRLHEDMGYDRAVDYSQPPGGPMSADDLAWIDERLRAAGRRAG